MTALTISPLTAKAVAARRQYACAPALPGAALRQNAVETALDTLRAADTSRDDQIKACKSILRHGTQAPHRNMARHLLGELNAEA